MKKTDYRNGSRESRIAAVKRIEAMLNQLQADLKNLLNPGKPSPENGFKKFAQDIFDRRN